eukprot:3633121-Amphidinium_carterae.2
MQQWAAAYFFIPTFLHSKVVCFLTKEASTENCPTNGTPMCQYSTTLSSKRQCNKCNHFLSGIVINC